MPKAIIIRLLIKTIIILLSISKITLAQDSKSNNKSEIDVIVFDYKIIEHQKFKKLIFPDTTIILENDEIADISPDGKMAGVLKYSQSPSSKASATIYNVSCDMIKKVQIAPYSIISMANDGRFAIYGFEPNDAVGLPSFIRFYTKEGKEIIPNKSEFGMFVYAVFSEDDDILVVAGVEEKYPIEFMHVNVTIYDKEFNKIGEYKIDDLSAYSQFRHPIIDTHEEIIKILISSGSGLNYKIDTTYIEYSGALLNLK